MRAAITSNPGGDHGGKVHVMRTRATALGKLRTSVVVASTRLVRSARRAELSRATMPRSLSLAANPRTYELHRLASDEVVDEGENKA